MLYCSWESSIYCLNVECKFLNFCFHANIYVTQGHIQGHRWGRGIAPPPPPPPHGLAGFFFFLLLVSSEVGHVWGYSYSLWHFFLFFLGGGGEKKNMCRSPPWHGPYTLHMKNFFVHIHVQWNLVIKRSDITKPSSNKVIFWSQLSIFLCFFTLI